MQELRGGLAAAMKLNWQAIQALFLGVIALAIAGPPVGRFFYNRFNDWRTDQYIREIYRNAERGICPEFWFVTKAQRLPPACVGKTRELYGY